MPRKKKTEVILEDDNHQNVVVDDEGKEIHRTKDFGCGIDVHASFIQVSVLVKQNLSIFEFRKQFSTDTDSLVEGKNWVYNVIKTNSIPPIDPSTRFHYCIESTSNYHRAILLLWEGFPSVVNPVLARAGSKKTDILDAKTLAISDLTGIWPESYIPSLEVIELRMLIAEKDYYTKLATQISNRINNSLLGLGITVGRSGSVTGNSEIKDKVMALLSDDVTKKADVSNVDAENAVPELIIPEDVRCIFRKDYEQYDLYRKSADEYHKLILDKVRSMDWETANGVISGTRALEILTTVPGVGVNTAVLWLSRVVTPCRFNSVKALAAYCGCDPSLKVSAGKVTSTVKRGGRKDLHSSLCAAAANIIRHHSEPFGRFGFRIAQSSGTWKKGVSALARKMSVAMYYVMLRNEPFSYENYKMVTTPIVLDIPIETLVKLNPAFKRYQRYLYQNGIYTTKILAHEYCMCKLPSIKGLGKNFYSLTKDFMENQDKYMKLYSEVEDENKN